MDIDLTGIATVLLALATFITAGLIHRQVKLGRQEFIATHRPRLILRGALSYISDPLEECIEVTYTIANLGDTPATITQMIVGVEFVTADEYPGFISPIDASKFPLNNPITIGAGESYKGTYVAENHRWDRNHRQRFIRLTLGVHFVGHVVYVDQADPPVRREMAWRRRHNIDSQRFIKIWDEPNEHEYAD